jgi:hypothetical protein
MILRKPLNITTRNYPKNKGRKKSIVLIKFVIACNEVGVNCRVGINFNKFGTL